MVLIARGYDSCTVHTTRVYSVCCDNLACASIHANYWPKHMVGVIEISCSRTHVKGGVACRFFRERGRTFVFAQGRQYRRESVLLRGSVVCIFARLTLPCLALDAPYGK